jgi:hypothetical protein
LNRLDNLALKAPGPEQGNCQAHQAQGTDSPYRAKRGRTEKAAGWDAAAGSRAARGHDVNLLNGPFGNVPGVERFK